MWEKSRYISGCMILRHTILFLRQTVWRYRRLNMRIWTQRRMMNPLFSTTVYDGKKSLDDITIFSSDLEENGIEMIAETEPIIFSAQQAA